MHFLFVKKFFISTHSTPSLNFFPGAQLATLFSRFNWETFPSSPALLEEINFIGWTRQWRTTSPRPIRNSETSRVLLGSRQWLSINGTAAVGWKIPVGVYLPWAQIQIISLCPDDVIDPHRIESRQVQGSVCSCFLLHFRWGSSVQETDSTK